MNQLSYQQRKVKKRKQAILRTKMIALTGVSLITCTLLIFAGKALAQPNDAPDILTSEDAILTFADQQNTILQQSNSEQEQPSDAPSVTEALPVIENSEDKNASSTPLIQEESAIPQKKSANNMTSKVPQKAEPDGDWKLLLVNPWNTIPENYDISLIELRNSQSVDERIYSDLQKMMDDCRAAGLSPLVCSSYRTNEKQTRLFNNLVENYRAQGYSQEISKIEAAKWVAVPGTSEHQLGLAVDIVSSSNQNLDKSQALTAEQKWLNENSYKYGFILRYPSDKSDITGISFEPWHYRYVGNEAAAEIKEKGICLEEYLQEKK